MSISDLRKDDYSYTSEKGSPALDYLQPVVFQVAAQEASRWSHFRIFDLGAGNGILLHHLAQAGYTAKGVDPSEQGVRLGRNSYPEIELEFGSSEDDLAQRYGSFPLVVSLEVIEHVFRPHLFAQRLFDLTLPGGLALISTPYHGYGKNLALALSGKMDAHFTVLWEGGHIKFWSFKTLRHLLAKAGFVDIQFRRVGRIPILAKSMIALARRPEKITSIL